MSGKDKAGDAPAEGGEEITPIDDGGGKSKKKLIIILVPLLLLGGGGAAAYFTGMLDKFLGKTEAAKEAGAEGETTEKAEEAEGGGGEHGEGGGPSVAFVKIPDLMVNLNNDLGGEQRYLRLSVQLELENAADQPKIEAVLPRVVDQFQTLSA